VLLAALFPLALPSTALAQTIGQPHWPQWRGPLGTGAAIEANPPLEWSPTKNIRWKTALPGKGHSTPIVWGKRVFVTAAVAYGETLPPRYSTAPGTHDGVPVTHRHQFVAIALDRGSGAIVWQRTLNQKLPHEGGHYTGSLASNSPVTDGEHVFAFFGTYGLYCLTMDGDLKWSKHFGEMQTKHGHGESASPVLHGDTLAVNWDHEGDSFVVALDKRTGDERWKVDRAEETSWASPIIVEHQGRLQLVVSGTNRVRGYDLTNGRVIWECGGMASNIVATPVAAAGMVFAGSSYEKRALLAIRLEGAAGDITGSKQVAWSRFRGTPYVPSPLVYGGSLYFLSHYQGILTRVNAVTGADEPGAVRLPGIGDIYASPVAAANRIYVTDLQGATMVVSHAEKPRILGINQLHETISASAAICGDELFLRGEKHLYCIAEKPDDPPSDLPNAKGRDGSTAAF
jgi:outer membrane protein assembly factor BamB